MKRSLIAFIGCMVFLALVMVSPAAAQSSTPGTDSSMGAGSPAGAAPGNNMGSSPIAPGTEATPGGTNAPMGSSEGGTNQNMGTGTPGGMGPGSATPGAAGGETGGTGSNGGQSR